MLGLNLKTNVFIGLESELHGNQHLIYFHREEFTHQVDVYVPVLALHLDVCLVANVRTTRSCKV